MTLGDALAIDATTAAVVIYASGVLLGLAFIDARFGPRVALALLWPLGPLAFVVTLAILIIVALFVFPWFGATMLVASGVVWWLAR